MTINDVGIRRPTVLFCILVPVATANADTCELQGIAISRTLVNVNVDDQRFEPYFVEDVPASAELGAESARVHLRSPFDFLAWTQLDNLTVYARRHVSLADGLVELQQGAALRPRQQRGGVVFESWFGPFTVVNLSPPCDALTLDHISSEELRPTSEEQRLERRAFKPGIVELSRTPGVDGAVRIRVDSPADDSVDVLERRGRWRRIRFRSKAARLEGWIREEQLGPARHHRGGWASGMGGVMCDRPPLVSRSAVRARIDPGTVVRIGSPDGREFGTVSGAAGFEAAGFEVELDPSRTAAVIHRAPRVEGGCAPEASDHRLDSLWVPTSAVHPEAKVPAAPRR